MSKGNGKAESKPTRRRKSRVKSKTKTTSRPTDRQTGYGLGVGAGASRDKRVIPDRAPKWMGQVLREVAMGKSISHAMDDLGVDRDAYYDARKRIPGMREAMDDAREAYFRHWSTLFLASFQALPNVRIALEQSGLKGNSTYYAALNQRPEFAAQVEFARQRGIGGLELELFKRAKYSDKLLIFALRHNWPEKYGTRAHELHLHNHNVPTTKGAVAASELSDETLSSMIADLELVSPQAGGDGGELLH